MSNMKPHRVETTLEQDGTLTLNELPFNAGDAVEVIILARSPKQNGQESYPLRGQPIYYDEPTEPVAEADWDALR
jgi:hypothetical protein